MDDSFWDAAAALADSEDGHLVADMANVADGLDDVAIDQVANTAADLDGAFDEDEPNPVVDQPVSNSPGSFEALLNRKLILRTGDCLLSDGQQLCS